MNDLTPRQDDAVQGKYEALYGAMAQVAKAVIADASIPPERKFAHLKEMLSGVWTGVTTIVGARGAELQWDVLMGLVEAYRVTPASWLEGAQRVAGTQKQRDDAVDRIFIDRVHHYLPKDCDLILDLGCGWGHRLFDVWRTGGPKSALYMGCDRSLYTREIIVKVSRLFPQMRVGWMPFDFLMPDFSIIPGQFRNVAIYSFHAIEQVPVLGPALFRQILARFPEARIRGIHLEPVGFQIEHTDHRAAEAAENVRDWAIKRKYNLDLLEQIQSNPELKLTATENAILTRDLANTTSVVVWDKV